MRIPEESAGQFVRRVAQKVGEVALRITTGRKLAI
jgi:hypothetical protein